MILTSLFSVLGARFFFLPLVFLFRRSGNATVSSIPLDCGPAHSGVVYTLQNVLQGIGLSAAYRGQPVFCRLLC